MPRSSLRGPHEDARRPPHYAFGATGDVARRKLLPGSSGLPRQGCCPPATGSWGARPRRPGRSRIPRARTRRDRRVLRRPADREAWDWSRPRPPLRRCARPRRADRGDGDGRAGLGGSPRRLHYLSVPPVASARRSRRSSRPASAPPRVIDREAVRHRPLLGTRAERLLHAAFDESQIFRIDHFLGKETVQNILAFRFANGVFETIWNRHHIDHVQIDIPETLSIGRAAILQGTGAFRDMLVTHCCRCSGSLPWSRRPRSRRRRSRRDGEGVRRDDAASA